MVAQRDATALSQKEGHVIVGVKRACKRCDSLQVRNIDIKSWLIDVHWQQHVYRTCKINLHRKCMEEGGEEGGDTVPRTSFFAFALPERRLGGKMMEPCLVMAGLINGGRTKKVLAFSKSSIILDIFILRCTKSFDKAKAVEPCTRVHPGISKKQQTRGAAAADRPLAIKVTGHQTDAMFCHEIPNFAHDLESDVVFAGTLGVSVKTHNGGSRDPDLCLQGEGEGRYVCVCQSPGAPPHAKVAWILVGASFGTWIPTQDRQALLSP